jgi:hypothetical protein
MTKDELILEWEKEVEEEERKYNESNDHFYKTCRSCYKLQLLVCLNGLKILDIPPVSVAKHPLPRPLEAWKKARELSLSDYINWHMTKEAWE